MEFNPYSDMYAEREAHLRDMIAQKLDEDVKQAEEANELKRAEELRRMAEQVRNP